MPIIQGSMNYTYSGRKRKPLPRTKKILRESVYVPSTPYRRVTTEYEGGQFLCPTRKPLRIERCVFYLIQLFAA